MFVKAEATMEKCKICGIEREYGDAYLHQECDFKLSYNNKSVEHKTRKQWERISKSVSPKIFDSENNSCKKCGNAENLTVDHIVPISKGGTNDKDNLQALCGSCNSKKGNR